MDLLRWIALAWIQYREFLAAFAALKRLSDRQLGDLGLARGDIARAALEQAERRTAALALSRPRARAAGDGDAMAAGSEQPIG